MASTSEQAREIPVDDLRAQLNGELVTAENPSYDEARQVFFKGVDKRPLAVARVAGAEDVAAVVNAAREGGSSSPSAAAATAAPGTGPSTAVWSSTSPG